MQMVLTGSCIVKPELLNIRALYLQGMPDTGYRGLVKEYLVVILGFYHFLHNTYKTVW